MIAITKATSDSGSAIIIKNYQRKSKIKDASARVSKSATLDGGVVVIHSGFADGDRKIDIRARLSESLSDSLWSVFRSETFINFAIPDGVFSAAISKLKIDNGDAKMIMEIASKLSA